MHLALQGGCQSFGKGIPFLPGAVKYGLGIGQGGITCSLAKSDGSGKRGKGKDFFVGLKAGSGQIFCPVACR